jgi:hypothetical protein
MFNIFKVMEIKFTYENKINSLLINSVWINLVSLGSMYYSLEGLFNNDYVSIVFYILGSIIGKWFAMVHYNAIKDKLKPFFKKHTNDKRSKVPN